MPKRFLGRAARIGYRQNIAEAETGRASLRMPRSAIPNPNSFSRRTLHNFNFRVGEPVELVDELVDLAIRRRDLTLQGRAPTAEV